MYIICMCIIALKHHAAGVATQLSATVEQDRLLPPSPISSKPSYNSGVTLCTPQGTAHSCQQPNSSIQLMQLQKLLRQPLEDLLMVKARMAQLD